MARSDVGATPVVSPRSRDAAATATQTEIATATTKRT